MTPELYRPLAVEQIGPAGLDFEVRADAAECAALAARMAVPAVAELLCRFRLTALPGGLVLAEGHLRAQVARECVVTLETFAAPTEERFRLRFVPAGSETPGMGAGGDDPESDDEIGYDAGTIDLGEATAEQLALALDPYPRKPGAALPEIADETPELPFAALARLKPPR